MLFYLLKQLSLKINVNKLIMVVFKAKDGGQIVY